MVKSHTAEGVSRHCGLPRCHRPRNSHNRALKCRSVRENTSANPVRDLYVLCMLLDVLCRAQETNSGPPWLLSSFSS